jgi:hypothetical protein
MESIRYFVTRFFEDIVYFCPVDHDIHFIFKAKYSTINAKKPLVLYYMFSNELSDIELPRFMEIAYNNIEVIHVSPDVNEINKALPKALKSINHWIDTDPTHINIILDFASMFILYKCVPNKSVYPHIKL